MAHDFTKINTAIWSDDDWRSLTRDEHWLYFLLVTHPQRSAASVCDWRPGRLAALAANTTASEVRAIGTSLQSKRFLLIDEDTEEVLIRPHLKFDERMKQPNSAKAVANAHAGTASKKIQRVIVFELRGIRKNNPEWSAFTSEASKNVVDNLLDQPGTPIDEFLDRSNNPSLYPSENPSDKGKPISSVKGFPTQDADVDVDARPSNEGGAGGNPLEPIEDQPTARVSVKELFDQFWEAYPRKDDKGKAREKFKAALNRASAEEIISGAERYRDDPNRDPAYTKLPTTWLNADAWGNGPLPRRNPQGSFQTSAERRYQAGAQLVADELAELQQHFTDYQEIEQ